MIQNIRSMSFFIKSKEYEISQKNKAFTLAEVLITLAIIGIVAALTIPVVMNNIQDRQLKEGTKRAYSLCSSALNQMKQDLGGSFPDYTNNPVLFETTYMQYFKVIKDCGWNACVNYTPNNYLNLYGDPAYLSLMQHGQFVTVDGLFIAIGPPSGVPIYISVDVNGYQTKPNQWGKDLFMFQIVNDNLMPMGALGTWLYRNDDFYCRKTNNHIYSGMGCASFVINGINY